MEAEGWVWSRAWPRRQDRKRCRLETSHKRCREAGRRAECWKSACSVRRGGGWKRVYGSASEALPEETGSKQLGWTYGAPRQSSTLQTRLFRARRNRSARDRDERVSGTVALIVKRPGHELSAEPSETDVGHRHALASAESCRFG